MTRDILDCLLATCASDRQADARGAAILTVAFASGGRRRSEVAGLRAEQVQEEPPAPLDRAAPNSAALPCLAIRLGRNKRMVAADDGEVLSVAALRERPERTDIAKGRAFRAIDRPGAAVDQPDRQAPVRGGGSRPAGLVGARTAGMQSDRSGAAASRCRKRCNNLSTARSSMRELLHDAKRPRGRATRLGV